MKILFIRQNTIRKNMQNVIFVRHLDIFRQFMQTSMIFRKKRNKQGFVFRGHL